MRKLITTFAFLLTLLSTYAGEPASGSVSFYDGGFERMKALALQQQKPYFISFQDNGIPSTNLENYTYSDPQLVDYVSEQYMAMRLLSNAGQQWVDQLMKKYQVMFYPTVILFSPEGKVLHKVTGFVNPQDFLGMLQRNRFLKNTSISASHPVERVESGYYASAGDDLDLSIEESTRPYQTDIKEPTPVTPIPIGSSLGAPMVDQKSTTNQIQEAPYNPRPNPRPIQEEPWPTKEDMMVPTSTTYDEPDPTEFIASETEGIPMNETETIPMNETATIPFEETEVVPMNETAVIPLTDNPSPSEESTVNTNITLPPMPTPLETTATGETDDNAPEMTSISAAPTYTSNSAKLAPPTKILDGDGLFRLVLRPMEYQGMAVQTGVYGDYENVIREVSRLEYEYGQTVLVDMMKMQGKTVYRILIGPFDQNEADEFLQRYNSLERNNAILKDLASLKR